MKKQLLFAAILTSSLVQAQSLTSANEPAIGEYTQMFSCDPSTDNLSTITGASVTWDYSQIVGLNGSTQVIGVVDPAATPNAADFPTSTKAMQVENSITNYFSSTATERVSQGFVYEEATLGVVIATYDIDEQVVIEYPFSNGDYFSDVFSGSLDFTLNGLPQNPVCNGNSLAAIDGQGTLLLPNATTITNVIRYKLVDTVFTQVDTGIFGVMDIEFIRVQFEYYDVTASNLPLFIHTSIVFQQEGATTPLGEQQIVVSSVEPVNQLGIADNTAHAFTVFPNPSEGTLYFKGDFASEATATIVDNSGRIISSLSTLKNGQSTDLSHLNKGTYHVVIQNNGVKSIRTIVLR